MFKPLHKEHAIESVIFRLMGLGEMTEHERVLLDRGYEDCWKAVLPAVNRGQVMEISMAPRLLTDERQNRLHRPSMSNSSVRAKPLGGWRLQGQRSQSDARGTVAGKALAKRLASYSGA